MKNTGWVRLWRGQFDSWVSKKPFCDGYAWCYLYATANHKAGTVNFRNEYIKIERGQFLTSKLQLQKRFSWTYRHVENFLKALQNDEMITYRAENRYTIINIVNYERFQSKPEDIVEQSEEQVDNRVITERKQGNTNKNVKNEDNGEELTSIVAKKLAIPIGDIRNILDFLNKTTGMNYKLTDAFKRKIHARVNEGFELDDFKKVITKKTREWKGTPDEKYLRPETLFGNKFDGYLNTRTIRKAQNYTIPCEDFGNGDKVVKYE